MILHEFMPIIGGGGIGVSSAIIGVVISRKTSLSYCTARMCRKLHFGLIMSLGAFGVMPRVSVAPPQPDDLRLKSSGGTFLGLQPVHIQGIHSGM